ncbi:hypothetical protein, partial [Pseudomonas sp. FSL A6-1183]
ITERTREHTQFLIDGDTEGAELSILLRDGLLITQANIEEKINALRSNRPVTRLSNDSGLLKQRHPNRDFFLADIFDYTLKDVQASME